VEEGGILETQNDVPKEFRERLYAKDQQSLEKRQTTTTSASTANIPPIHITNMLPGKSCQTYQSTTTPTLQTATPVTRLDIPGFRDITVKDYYTWQ